MQDPVTLTVKNGIATVLIDNPPVNALGHQVRVGLRDAAARIGDDTQIRAAVIMGRSRFSAGADIREFGSDIAGPSHSEVFNQIEGLMKPVVAAIDVTALGGGAELAMACHYRIATPTARIGFPEVKLGILPGAGGTQRLPRLIGAEAALDMMLSGKPITAAKALELGLVDKLSGDADLLAQALRLATEMMNFDSPLPRSSTRDARIKEDRADKELFARIRSRNARAMRHLLAPEAIIRCVEAAVTLPFEEGVRVEKAESGRLMASDQAKALSHVFFAMRQTAKIPDVPAHTPVKPINSVGVIGAGTMGGGIAMNFANVGIPVTMVEVKAEALDRGLSVIIRNYENTAAKGKLTQEQVDRRLSAITGTLAMDDLAHCDLIIEAVFESMEIKEQVFSQLDRIAKPGAVLASNTSFLDIDHIAGFTKRPDDVLGLHFFSPANVMPLLEVVRGEQTSNTVLATAMKLSRQIGKTPVLARVCDGFIANRLMLPYLVNAQEMLVEGTSMEEIDAAMTDYGFAMGPISLLDLVGLDVVTFPGEIKLTEELVKQERRGQKLNGGFYDYDDRRRATPSPAALAVIDDVRQRRGIRGDRRRQPEEIVTGLLYPVINEGAQTLDEGIALRSGDIDVTAILGYNWPDFTGGPMCWADQHGLARIVDGLKKMGHTPAPLLTRLAREGGSFSG
ncbi:3-hydroxyacyl-CoA dehydrogenase NAD-binding domain-containing protein [Croceicoccus sp. F390]|uniref:3-hydroxyacyl-CoA dehydrogenase NAD-binding domain-containing protein n=1 Tax=Croceicoccus esteveae TaxID=3075597 RepID=A0ABU2ZEG3_9SPHN|nr:3-hydroxyacyl-CoA dehydrogenase NAD-binding domain-containing protein [Croceicoccus sp. F390]MDT0574991.1 3-hydroxyacyl-CoA dehydrogenase NAD-binding domain-containing protein [Croceicoccus sp. F390]